MPNIDDNYKISRRWSDKFEDSMKKITKSLMGEIIYLRTSTSTEDISGFGDCQKYETNNGQLYFRVSGNRYINSKNYEIRLTEIKSLNKNGGWYLYAWVDGFERTIIKFHLLDVKRLADTGIWTKWNHPAKLKNYDNPNFTLIPESEIRNVGAIKARSVDGFTMESIQYTVLEDYWNTPKQKTVFEYE